MKKLCLGVVAVCFDGYLRGHAVAQDKISSGTEFG